MSVYLPSCEFRYTSLLVLYAVIKVQMHLSMQCRCSAVLRNPTFSGLLAGKVEMVRFELMTPCLPDKCSPSELHPHVNVCHCYRSDILGDDRHLYLYIKAK